MESVEHDNVDKLTAMSCSDTDCLVKLEYRVFDPEKEIYNTYSMYTRKSALRINQPVIHL